MFDYLDYRNKIPLNKILETIEDIHPYSPKYSLYWINDIKRKQIEGKWVQYKGEWKWIPGPIFQYIQLWNIEIKQQGTKSKGKVIGRPRLRDIEWIKGYVHAVSRGFSGFEKDENYSSHRVLINPDRDDIISTLSNEVKSTLYKPSGELKEYKDALQYLYEYLPDNYGKPLYLNEAKNVIDIECRNIGKDLWEETTLYYDYGPGKIKDVKIGDKILGDDGKLTTVTNRFDFNDQVQFEIKLKKVKEPILCGLGHQWLIRTIAGDFVREFKDFKDYKDHVLLPYKKSFEGKMEWSQIEYIKEAGVKPSVCITVDNESKLFIAGDLIVTHNTMITGNFAGHNFLTDGITDFDEYIENKNKPESEKVVYTTQTLISAIDGKYVNNLVKHLKTGLEYLPGRKQVGETLFPPPLSKTIRGSWRVGEDVKNEYDYKVGNKWEVRGTKSGFNLRSFMDNPFAANGLRYGFGVIDEIGFMGIIEEVLGQLEECTTVDGEKYGSIWMCVCEGTKIFKGDGSIINIEDLKKEDGIIGWDYKIKSESPTTIHRMFPPVYKECYRITTNKGKTLECSFDHPILWSRKDFGSKIRSKDNKCGRKFIKNTKWVNAENISIGDQIAVPEKVSVFGNETIKDPRFIGMLIGDGSYGLDKTPVFSNCDSELIKYVYDNYDAIEEKGYITKQGKEYKELRVRGICPMLRELGIYGQTKVNKRLPNIISSCTEETVSELLAGLYDTDGHVTYDKNKKINIGLTSSSRDMLIEVNMLLHKLGIHASLCEVKPRIEEGRKDKNIYYKLIISDKRSALRFYEKIKLMVSYKRDNLNKFIDELNIDKIRQSKSIEGLRFERVINVENIGSRKVYNLTASGHNTYIANGIVTHNTGTGGDFKDGGATHNVRKVFEDPKAYNCLEFDDIFENSGKKIGFFVPAWMALDEFRDEFGNVNKELALKKLNREREEKKKAKTKQAYYNLLPTKPLSWTEAFLSTSRQRFPANLIEEQIKILTEPELKKHEVGKLMFNAEGKLEFIHDFNLDPYREYPVKEFLPGAIEIFERPQDSEDAPLIPFRYIIGVDPYKYDVSKEIQSIGSCIVFDRLTRRIVAEYSGRPDTTNIFYETCRKLCLFYNATLMYESNFTNMYHYFEEKRSLHLLADTPMTLRDRNTWKINTNTSKGIIATTPINERGLEFIENYLMESLSENSDLTRTSTVRSLGLLRELRGWTPDNNTDRISAFSMVMWYDITLGSLSNQEEVRERNQKKFGEYFNQFRKNPYNMSKTDMMFEKHF